MIADEICILTAFSVVPQNFLILRCCFSHLKNLGEVYRYEKSIYFRRHTSADFLKNTFSTCHNYFS